MEFGYEGLGLFYTTLEKMGKQEKPINTIALKAQLKVGKRLDKCWNFMEEIGIIQSNNGETFNKELLNFSEKYQIKKEKNREKVSEWREKQRDKETVTSNVPVRNRPKVKKSKVKETKISKIKYAEFVFLSKIEFKKLEDEHGEYWAKELITMLDNYKGSSGKTYASDYRAILSWVVDKLKSSPKYIDWRAKQRRKDVLARSRGEKQPIPGAEQIGTKINEAPITNETPPKIN